MSTVDSCGEMVLQRDAQTREQASVSLLDLEAWCLDAGTRKWSQTYRRWIQSQFHVFHNGAGCRCHNEEEQDGLNHLQPLTVHPSSLEITTGHPFNYIVSFGTCSNKFRRFSFKRRLPRVSSAQTWSGFSSYVRSGSNGFLQHTTKYEENNMFIYM